MLSCEVLSTPGSHFSRVLEIVVKAGARDFDSSMRGTSERAAGRNGLSPLPRPALCPHFHPLPCVSTVMCCRDPATASVQPCVTPLASPASRADPASPCPSLWSHIVWPWRVLASPPVPFWSSFFFLVRHACSAQSIEPQLSSYHENMAFFLIMSFF